MAKATTMRLELILYKTGGFILTVSFAQTGPGGCVICEKCSDPKINLSQSN